MKKTILIFAMFAGTLVSSAQFKRVALTFETGINAVGDESATVQDPFAHYGASVRYSFNEIASIAVSGSKDDLNLVSFEGEFVKTDYARVSAELYVDFLEIIELQNNFFTILLHGGPGSSRIDTPGYNQTMFSGTGGADILFKLGKRAAITFGYRHTANVTHDRTIDGVVDVTNSNVNSTVTNFTAGLTIYIGGKLGENEPHADWYVAPEPEYIQTHNTFITKEVTEVIEKDCDCPPQIIYQTVKPNVKQLPNNKNQ